MRRARPSSDQKYPIYSHRYLTVHKPMAATRASSNFPCGSAWPRVLALRPSKTLLPHPNPNCQLHPPHLRHVGCCQGKSAPKLFSESCVTCHRSPRGLAKGRFRLTLYMFLQKHYASGSGSAWALASYLESVDSAKRERAKGAKRPAGTTGTGQSSIRPPASVPKQ